MKSGNDDKVALMHRAESRRSGTGRMSGGVEATGVLDSRQLPDEEFLALWDAVIVEAALKERLLSQALLNFTVRGKVERALFPLHGLIVLHGPPGTGKTSLARGLAARTAQSVQGLGAFLYIEVEPHSLTSAALGRSQRAVKDLLAETIATYADRGPLVVLLDEVETLAADRTKMSLEANPIDVHRATDVVLAQLDQLAATYPRLLFIATSNFTRAVDSAFLSRADSVEYVPPPPADACRQILATSLEALGQTFPGVRRLVSSQDLDEIAKKCEGLDGRRIRKVVARACAMDKAVALDPGTLTMEHLRNAVLLAQDEAQRESKEER